MQAATLLQNPARRIQQARARTGESIRTGPPSPITGNPTPRSVEQTEGRTPAVIAAREADRRQRGRE